MYNPFKKSQWRQSKEKEQRNELLASFLGVVIIILMLFIYASFKI